MECWQVSLRASEVHGTLGVVELEVVPNDTYPSQRMAAELPQMSNEVSKAINLSRLLK
jgi:hypothetical protein